ncbi:MAG: hypothetical protein RLZZ210_872 [Pseudomonadota bacterium]
MKNITLIFCHGWAYNSQIFCDVIKQIESIKLKSEHNLNIYNLDLGFFEHNSNKSNPYNQRFIDENELKSHLEIAKQNNHHIIWIGHSYGLMHGGICCSSFIHQYIGINSLLDFSSYKVSIKAMLKQINSGNVSYVLHNFYAWCGDEQEANLYIDNTKNNLNINIPQLTLCLENMFSYTYEIWNTKESKLSVLVNKHDVFVFENKNDIVLEFKEVEYMQNPHMLPKIAIDVCNDFIFTHIK